MQYRRLEKDEVIEERDEIDRCVDPWKDYPKWEPVHKNEQAIKIMDCMKKEKNEDLT